jgi:hypothetical protein
MKAAFASSCEKMKKKLSDSYLTRRVIHEEITDEIFSGIYGTDDDPRDVTPVMAPRKESTQGKLKFSNGRLTIIKPAKATKPPLKVE